MDLDFTQMNRTLKKVMEGTGFEPAIKRLTEWCLGNLRHQALLTMNVECNILDPKQNSVR